MPAAHLHRDLARQHDREVVDRDQEGVREQPPDRGIGAGRVDGTPSSGDSTGRRADGEQVDNLASGVRCAAEQLAQLRGIFEHAGQGVNRGGGRSDADSRIADARQCQVGEQPGELAARNMLKQRARGWSEGGGCRHQIADDGKQPQLVIVTPDHYRLPHSLERRHELCRWDVEQRGQGPDVGRVGG